MNIGGIGFEAERLFVNNRNPKTAEAATTQQQRFYALPMSGKAILRPFRPTEKNTGMILTVVQTVKIINKII